MTTYFVDRNVKKSGDGLTMETAFKTEDEAWDVIEHDPSTFRVTDDRRVVFGDGPLPFGTVFKAIEMGFRVTLQRIDGRRVTFERVPSVISTPAASMSNRGDDETP
jgi:hypothetical protein